jgi:hypothetical protein
MAVLLLRAAGVTPGLPTGVADVPPTHPFAPWIETLLAQGVTSGCGVAPLRFCPDGPVTRAQLAVLLIRLLAVPGVVPPPATGFLFLDVPASDPFAPWIEELVLRQLTSGCLSHPVPPARRRASVRGHRSPEPRRPSS